MPLEMLFPTPVGFEDFTRPLTTEEIDFSKNITLRPNILNKTSVDTYVLKNPAMTDINTFVTEKVKQFFDDWWKPANDVSLYITQSWINHSRPGEQHHVHSHPNSIISGVFYLSADKNIDNITFIGRDGAKDIQIMPRELNKVNAPQWYYPVHTGLLVLFPSSLAHTVSPVDRSPRRDIRISLSFNTFVKGVINPGESLSELIL
jgi:uncharacterized protein (TIGR02466 family)